MSYLAAAAITERIREVLQDSAGDARTVPSGRFLGGIPAGMAEQTRRLKALSAPRIAVSIPRNRRHPQSPPSNGSFRLYSLDIEIRIERTVPSRIAKLTDAENDAVRALAIEDADVIGRALEHDNLRTTAAGVATGLCSGVLTYVDSTQRISSTEDAATTLIETIHAFTGAAKATV